MDHDELMKSMAEFEEVQPPCRDKPCAECPFLRTSMPGHLGPHTVEEWVEAAHGEGPMACHMTIRADGSWKRTKQCAGMAQFRKNIMKSPRSPLIAVAAERNTDAVFARGTEMIEHHNS